MKKNIGNRLVLYPTPIVVVGAEVDGKVTWTLVAHVGIVAHDRLLISLFDKHYINKGIKETKNMSVNIVTEDFLPEADYCGIVSGEKTDKSQLFAYTRGQAGTPMIDKSPLTMECNVEDVYQCNGFNNFICSIENTYAEDDIVDMQGRPDYTRLHPVLFEMPSYSYLRTGKVIAPCMRYGKEYKKQKTEKI